MINDNIHIISFETERTLLLMHKLQLSNASYSYKLYTYCVLLFKNSGFNSKTVLLLPSKGVTDIDHRMCNLFFFRIF